MQLKCKPRMSKISLQIPSSLIKDLDSLVEQSFFPSRSEGVRFAVNFLLLEIKKAPKETEDLNLLLSKVKLHE